MMSIYVLPLFVYLLVDLIAGTASASVVSSSDSRGAASGAGSSFFRAGISTVLDAETEDLPPLAPPPPAHDSSGAAPPSSRTGISDAQDPLLAPPPPAHDSSGAAPPSSRTGISDAQDPLLAPPPPVHDSSGVGPPSWSHSVWTQVPLLDAETQDPALAPSPAHGSAFPVSSAASPPTSTNFVRRYPEETCLRRNIKKVPKPTGTSSCLFPQGLELDPPVAWRCTTRRVSSSAQLHKWDLARVVHLGASAFSSGAAVEREGQDRDSWDEARERDWDASSQQPPNRSKERTHTLESFLSDHTMIDHFPPARAFGGGMESVLHFMDGMLLSRVGLGRGRSPDGEPQRSDFPGSTEQERELRREEWERRRQNTFNAMFKVLTAKMCSLGAGTVNRPITIFPSM